MLWPPSPPIDVQAILWHGWRRAGSARPKSIRILPFGAVSAVAPFIMRLVGNVHRTGPGLHARVAWWTRHLNARIWQLNSARKIISADPWLSPFVGHSCLQHTGHTKIKLMSVQRFKFWTKKKDIKLISNLLLLVAGRAGLHVVLFSALRSFHAVRRPWRSKKVLWTRCALAWPLSWEGIRVTWLAGHSTSSAVCSRRTFCAVWDVPHT